MNEITGVLEDFDGRPVNYNGHGIVATGVLLIYGEKPVNIEGIPT